MGLLARLRPRRRARPAAHEDAGTLFDEAFLRKLESLALVSRKLHAGRQRAERRTRKAGSGVEFADHRDYVPGDDFRRIDWSVYQRFGRLLVRLHEEEEDLGIYFIVDCSSSMAFGGGAKFDQARRLVAALAYVGLANLDRVTVVAVRDGVAERMAPTRGKARIFRVLRFLSRLEARGSTDLGAALGAFAAQHRRKGLAVLVSDLYDPAGFERGINVLRYHRFEPYIVHLIDPAEERPALLGDVQVVDCETGDERAVTVTEALLGRLRDAQRGWRGEVAHFCASRHVPYFAAPTTQAFDELVLKVFRQGGFLR